MKIFHDRLAGEILPGDIFVLHDAGIDLLDDSPFFWKAFNNVAPRRDIMIGQQGVIIDATMKGPADGHDRPWPDDIEMSREIKEKVELLLQKYRAGQ
jgi:4-hydroxy-3-polyprenylbenzoate decarboxylase